MIHRGERVKAKNGSKSYYNRLFITFVHENQQFILDNLRYVVRCEIYGCDDFKTSINQRLKSFHHHYT